MFRLLFVDDDQQFLKMNEIYFKKQGFLVRTALTEDAAFSLLENEVFDCIILDIILTDTPDGYPLCQRIKACTNIPVIFLTSLSEQEALYRGFSSGGDDFMTKPYDFKELELRILARINQYGSFAAAGNILSYPPLVIDKSKRQVTIRGTAVRLTSNEFDILLLLACSPEKIFSLEDIYRNVWQMPDLDSTHTVQVHIGRMRRKLEMACPDHSFITTSWGKGYLFTPMWEDRQPS